MDRWQEDVLTAGGPIFLGLIEFSTKIFLTRSSFMKLMGTQKFRGSKYI